MNESLSQTVIANIALHDWEIGPRKMVLSLEAKERTCGRERAANYRYPGHEITALSLWKRLLPTQLDEVAKLRQPSPPLTFYLSSSILTRRFLRFDLALLPRSPGWNYVAWNFDKTGEDSARAGIRLNLSSYSPRGRKEETFRNGWLRDSKATCVRCPATCTHLLFETSLSLFRVSSLNLSLFALVILPVSLFNLRIPG